MRAGLAGDAAAGGHREETVKIALPLKTKNPLNSSAGFSKGATMAAARRRKSQRNTAALLTRAELNRHRAYPAPWTITLVRIAPSRGLDSDGLHAALKSIRDGVADALGYCDDSDPAFEWRYEQRREKPGEYAVEVVIESVTLEAP